jgi:hypothetical protein
MRKAAERWPCTHFSSESSLPRLRLAPTLVYVCVSSKEVAGFQCALSSSWQSHTNTLVWAPERAKFESLFLGQKLAKKAPWVLAST